MWEKREQDWENERVARKKLLEEVLSSQKTQARRFFFYCSASITTELISHSDRSQDAGGVEGA